ncbi:uncharacterized protein LOC125179185 [Hyalella azteca]|uniref:Uncharacterized protein LOC125179185 n=1 Tax=Hyalella azteca TaxID=294128 RepID=A0A979FTL5_HYAAZ|nr:uncharacterized protein LOC125179185 [Hyalella azteca]
MTDSKLRHFHESEFASGNNSTLSPSQDGDSPECKVVHRKRKHVPIANGEMLGKTKKRPKIIPELIEPSSSKSTIVVVLPTSTTEQQGSRVIHIRPADDSSKGMLTSLEQLSSVLEALPFSTMHVQDIQVNHQKELIAVQLLGVNEEDIASLLQLTQLGPWSVIVNVSSKPTIKPVIEKIRQKRQENISVKTAPAILKCNSLGNLHEINENVRSNIIKGNYSGIDISGRGSNFFVVGMFGPFEVIKSAKVRISSKFCSLEDYFYKPKFKSTEAEWERAKSWTNFQECLYNNKEFTPEDLENELNEKINKIAKHFMDFKLGTLDEKSMKEKKMNKVDYAMPYLPTYKDVEFLGKLFMGKESDADKDAVVEPLWKRKHDPNSKYNKGLFSEKESQVVNENWNQFQKVS